MGLSVIEIAVDQSVCREARSDCPGKEHCDQVEHLGRDADAYVENFGPMTKALITEAQEMRIVFRFDSVAESVF